jgi:alkylation response protein AidB-like acyl-CoA dehydrogenase
VQVTRTFGKMGLRTAPLGEVSFDVALPPDRLVGAEGSGMTQFHTALELERAGAFASVLGVMEAQLDRTIARARERTAFERPIGSAQSVSNRIVGMKMRVEIGRLLLDRFVWKKMRGRRAPMESAMVKLYLSEAFVQSSIDAVRVHGALGYVEEGGIEHYVRDAVGGIIFSGTSDIQRNAIAKMLGLSP